MLDERKFELRTLSLITLLLGLASGAGCMQPIGGPSRKPIGSSPSAKKKTNAESSTIVADSAKAFAVEKMTVQNETVEATELWRGHRDELTDKAKTLSGEELQAFVAKRSAELITDKIAEMLIYQKASLRQTPEVEKRVDAYIDGEIRKIVTAKYDGLQRRYEKYLESQGTNLDQVRNRYRREFVIAGYLENEVRPKVAEPTRADLVEAFASNKETWVRPERRSMSLIDIRASDLLPAGVNEPTREQLAAAREEARTRADAALVEVRGGGDFAELAKRYSHGANASEGGKWGWVNAADVRERFLPAVDALGKLTTGQTSNVIETPDGFFIVRCDEFEPAFVPTFESVQPQLKEYVSRRLYNHLVNELITELRSKARIEPANLDRFHASVVASGLEMVGSVRSGG